jgi:hypothetical protein
MTLQPPDHGRLSPRTRTVLAWTVIALALAAEVGVFILAQDRHASAWWLVPAFGAAVAAFFAFRFLPPRNGGQP